MKKTLNLHTLLSNLSATNWELYKKLEPVLSSSLIKEFTKDDLLFALIAEKFNFKGSLVELVDEVFNSSKEISKATQGVTTNQTKISNIGNRWFGNGNVNIQVGKSVNDDKDSNSVFQIENQNQANISSSNSKRNRIHRIDSTSCNISDQEFDELYIDCTLCRLDNVIVIRKLVVDCTSIDGKVNLSENCIVNIDSSSNNLKINYI